MKTLILLFHPDLKRSRTNTALADAARTIAGVEVVDMYALYLDGRIDAADEVARLLSADRIVLQFPVQWYSTPPLLKAWQDAVLTRMFYVAYETEGRLFEGTPLLVAATAGNRPDAYTPAGQNLIPLTELLSPLRVTAHRCRLPWTEPFVVYRAGALEAPELAAAARRYRQTLHGWIAGPVQAAA